MRATTWRSLPTVQGQASSRTYHHSRIWPAARYLSVSVTRRSVLNLRPRSLRDTCTTQVTFCGYSVPHPLENKMHLHIQVCPASSLAMWTKDVAVAHACACRCFSASAHACKSVFVKGVHPVQTKDIGAAEAMKSALLELMKMCDHVTSTFEDAENEYYQSGGTGH